MSSAEKILNGLYRSMEQMAVLAGDDQLPPEKFAVLSRKLAEQAAELQDVAPTELEQHRDALIGVLATITSVQQALAEGKDLTRDKIKEVVQQMNIKNSYGGGGYK